MLVTQSCPTLCDPKDCSLPEIHGILQARIPEWVAIPFSMGFSRPRDRTWVSCTAGEFFTIWATREAPKSLFIFWLHPLSMWDLSSLTRDQTHSPARECAIKTNMLFSALNLDFKESVPYLPLTLKNDTLFHLTSYRKVHKTLSTTVKLGRGLIEQYKDSSQCHGQTIKQCCILMQI